MSDYQDVVERIFNNEVTDEEFEKGFFEFDNFINDSMNREYCDRIEEIREETGDTRPLYEVYWEVDRELDEMIRVEWEAEQRLSQ